MEKILTLRLDDETYRLVCLRAQSENHTISGYIRYCISEDLTRGFMQLIDGTAAEAKRICSLYREQRPEKNPQDDEDLRIDMDWGSLFRH